MDANIVETLKLLLKDTVQLSKRVKETDNRSLNLEEELTALQERLILLENSQPTGGAVAAGLSTAAIAFDEANYLLDLPLARIIDAYHEIPALLEPICKRVALDLDSPAENSVVARNNQGNYWVLQLRSQGFWLWPRPGAFSRIAALEGMRKLFETEGNVVPEAGNHEFLVKQPAKLNLIKINQRWQLQDKGRLQFGEAPLEFRWQQEIRTLREQYQQLNDLLPKVGEAGLEATVTAYRWLQILEQRYGKAISVVVNTCMPMAYAIYKESNEGSVLVPCNVLTTGTPSVLPAWDQGIPWETSIYGKLHGKSNREVSRSSLDHPYLPNQPYLKEINGESTHTWAIANDYHEAANIVTQINGHWGSLEA
jgi:hypothetical protein